MIPVALPYEGRGLDEKRCVRALDLDVGIARAMLTLRCGKEVDMSSCMVLPLPAGILTNTQSHRYMYPYCILYIYTFTVHREL